MEEFRRAWRTFSPNGDWQDVLVAIAISILGGALVMFLIDCMLVLEPGR
jgi:hypothetical protein